MCRYTVQGKGGREGGRKEGRKGGREGGRGGREGGRERSVNGRQECWREGVGGREGCLSSCLLAVECVCTVVNV